MLADSLKTKLANRAQPLGLLLTFSFWPGYLEICRRQGLDFVVLDMEHGQVDLSQAEHLCRTARLLDLPLLIRPPACEVGVIKRSLDLGAGGLMLPWVETPAHLEALQHGAFCPPRGRHGMGGPALLAVDGVTAADWARMEAAQFLMCQIETPAGLEYASTVAGAEGVDALMVGPYDLAHTLGVVDDYLRADVHLEAIARVRDAAHGAGKWAGMVTGSGAEARRWFAAGFDLVIIGAETTHFTQGLAHNLAEGRAR